MAAPKLNAPFETQFNAERAQEFMILRLLRQIHTADVVKVLAVYPTAGTVGFVDVQPLVQDRDTNNVVIAQSPIFKLPYLRLQGGTSAIILDPAVGDLGLAVFAERDITNAVATREAGAPPTDRTYDTGDGLYFGGFLNADPTQWVKFTQAGGIDILSTGDLNLQAAGAMTLQAGGTLTMTAANVVINGATTFNNPIIAPQATIGGIPFTTHRHPNGSPNTGTPIA
ncbi:baseplate protein [Xanthomonas phage NEB7]|nr:baseplate protein [Xanthomonas phage NEB7]